MNGRSNWVGLRSLFLLSAKKLLLHRRWMVVVLLGAMVCAVMGYGASQDMADMGTASDMMDLLLLTFILPVMALIYGASMIRNEIDDRSIVQVVSSPMDRRLSYLGYFMALSLVLMVLMAIITAAAGASFFVMNWEDGALGLVPGYVLAMCVGALAYSSLFLLLGVVLKQPIYLGLFYVFIWEGFVGSIPGAIGDYTIRHQLRVMVSGLVDSGSIANVGGDPWSALLITMVLTTVLVVVGAFLLREKEIA